MRVLPHDQNTGGFYLALFRKLKPVALAKPVEALNKNTELLRKKEEKNEEDLEEGPEDPEALKVIEKLNKEEEIGESSKPKKNTYQPEKTKKLGKILWKPLENEDYEWIREYYGLSPDFPRDQLIYLIESGPKKILMISEAIKKVLEYDGKQVLNKINLGAKAFVRNKEGFSKNFCRFRICQDSIVALFPFVSKRKVKCSLQDFKFVLQKKNMRHDELPSVELQNKLKELGEGSVVLFLPHSSSLEENKALDVLVCQNFTKTLTIMCSKELYGSFYIKYC